MKENKALELDDDLLAAAAGGRRDCAIDPTEPTEPPADLNEEANTGRFFANPLSLDQLKRPVRAENGDFLGKL